MTLVTLPRKQIFTGIQALRGLAAMLVTGGHADEMWHLRLDPAHDMNDWIGGAAGVDIFFVISGFVMVVSSSRLRSVPGGWLEFAWRRFRRIAPYYWLITTAKIMSVIAVPALALHTVLTPGAVTASYLFLPWYDSAGGLETVLPVGWTLDVEAAFYALFAAALALNIGLLRVLLPCLAAAAALSLFATPAWSGLLLYCDPIMLEFASGLCLGWLGLRNRRLPVGFAAVAFLAGFAAILFIPPALPRLLCWGVPATLIAAGAVGLDPVFRTAALGWLRPLGDASYSIYLTHSFVIAALGVALGRWMPSSLYSFPVAIIAGCLFSAAVGLMAYRVVELPLLNAVTALRSKPVLSGLPDGPAELAFPATTSLNKADAEQ